MTHQENENPTRRLAQVTSISNVCSNHKKRSSSADSDGDNSESNQVCRICYYGEHRYVNEENPQSSRPGKKVHKYEKLLRQICKCKGELNYVHESCLIKWLSLKGTLKCELCLEEYNITYEFGSLKEIIKNGF